MFYEEMSLNVFMRDTGIATLKEVSEVLGVSYDCVRSWSAGRRYPNREQREKMFNVCQSIRAKQPIKPRAPRYEAIVPGSGGNTGHF